MKMNRRNFLKASAITGVAATGVSGGVSTLKAFSADNNEMNQEGKWMASTCQGCTSWCPVQVYVIDGRPIKVRGNPNAKNHEGKACVRSHLAIQQYYDPDRVKVPMKRTNPKKGRNEDPEFVPISWEEAIDTITNKMMALREKDETHKFALLRGRYTYLRDYLYGALPKIFGSPNGISHSTICAEGEKFGAYYTEGDWGYRDYDHVNTKYELLWGADPLGSNRQVPRSVNVWSQVKDQAKVACVDPRLSITAAKSNEWLPIIPGEDDALALAIAHVILTEGLWYKPFVGDFKDGNNQFVEGQMANEDEFEEIETNGVVKWWNLEVKDRTPEWAADITGIPVDQIRRVATDFGKAAPNCISYLSPGASMQIRGGYAAMATHGLNGLVGSVHNKGGVMMGMSIPTHGAPDYKDYIDKTAENGLDKENIVRSGRLEYPGLKEGKSGGSKMTNVVADTIIEEDPYNVEVMIGYWNNFNFSCSDTGRWDEAMAKVPFFAHLTVNPAEMTQFADIVLPCGHQMFERYGLLKSKGNRYSYATIEQPIADSLWDVRTDETEITWMIAESLANKGFTNLFDYLKETTVDPETGAHPENEKEFALYATKMMTKDLWDPSIKKDGDNHITSWEEMLEVGVWNSDPYPDKKNWGGEFPTETGKFEFYSETLKKALIGHADKHNTSVEKMLAANEYDVSGERAFVPHYEPAVRRGDDQKDVYPYIFSEHRSILNREARSSNLSWYQGFKDIDPGDEAWNDVIKINPIDAKELGIKSGDMVSVTSPVGSITVEAKEWEGTRPGVVSKCYGQGHWAYGRLSAKEYGKEARGGNNNDILPAVYEKLSGSTARHGGPVRVNIKKV